jgi:sugar lactone lactonase YvrE
VPSTHHFNILLRVPETTEKVKISVYDPVGRLVETIDNPPVGKTFAIGGNYAKGLYMVEIVLGKQKRVMKILKI